jgi:hypothetical protein
MALDRIVRSLRREARALRTPLEAELWASAIAAVWHQPMALRGDTPGAAPAPGAELVDALEAGRDAGALAGLRALAAVGGEMIADASAAAARRLAAAGVPEPAWGRGLAGLRAGAARLMHEPIFDDGLTVLVEFEHGDGARHTVGVHVDHNRCGLADDVFVGGPLPGIAAIMGAEEDERQVRLERITLADAAARMGAALARTDAEPIAPVAGGFWALRAFAGARLRVLPSGAAVPSVPAVSRAERHALANRFFDSPEGARLAGDDEAERAAMLAIDFCADRVDGRPLRWSPVVVDLFLADHGAPRPQLDVPRFAVLCDALCAWVRFAGRMHGVPADAVQQTVAVVDEWCEDVPEPASRRRGAALAATG